MIGLDPAYGPDQTAVAVLEMYPLFSAVLSAELTNEERWLALRVSHKMVHEELQRIIHGVIIPDIKMINSGFISRKDEQKVLQALGRSVTERMSFVTQGMFQFMEPSIVIGSHRFDGVVRSSALIVKGRIHPHIDRVDIRYKLSVSDAGFSYSVIRFGDGI